MRLFHDMPEEFRHYETARIVILPVPFDATSTWIKGADRGPAALLDASFTLELYDIETQTEVFSMGIFTADPVNEKSSAENMIKGVRSRITKYLADNKFPVIIGGEHTVSLGAIQALAEVNPGLSVLQIDAHADLRDEYHDSPYNHACIMARVAEICPIVQVGIRSMDKSELARAIPSNIFFAHELMENDDWMDRAIDRLSDTVYLTFDLDGLDPAIMPSTGTPEPGGLGWYQTLRFIKKLCERKNLVGFDIVELCPSDNHAPDFTAAKLLYKTLSYAFKGKEGGGATRHGGH